MTRLSALATALRRSLGPGIGVGTADPQTYGPALWPAEIPATRRMRDQRRLEFTAGRTAARAAMDDLHLPPVAVPMGPDRAPRWPAELCGSISHCQSAAVAVVAHRCNVIGIGIDIEEDVGLPAELWPETLSADDRSWLLGQPPADQGQRAKEVFCAKEAIHKLHHPLTGRMLGFHDVTVTWNGPRFETRLPVTAPELPDVLSGKVLRTEDLVLAVLTITRPQADT